MDYQTVFATVVVVVYLFSISKFHSFFQVLFLNPDNAGLEQRLNLILYGLLISFTVPLLAQYYSIGFGSVVFDVDMDFVAV